ncbi:MAG: TRASH domain-containing protein [Deltaproteobacteria bacterium]|nr:TRASH domain-containing protein [Deltaproteobacteria bacterium]
MFKKVGTILLLGWLLFIQTSHAVQLRKVTDTSHVCMVNNEVMGKPQIPVKVGEQTYYGCCKMCEGTLKKDRKARYSIDPVSGREVDKAKAIIGVKPDGGVLYFENERNFQAFTLK